MKALVGKWIFLSYPEHYKAGFVIAAVGEDCILVKFRPFTDDGHFFSGLVLP